MLFFSSLLHNAWLHVVIYSALISTAVVFLKSYKMKKWFNHFSYKRLKRNYFLGLNHLINQQPEQACNALMQILKADSESVEIQLAVANLYRRQGDLAKATQIHQSISSRDDISQRVRSAALIELGRDYLAAGVLDRAEAIFLQGVDLTTHSKRCLSYLLEIYQQEKNWQQAIEIGLKLQDYDAASSSLKLAHYACEIAEAAIAKHDIVAATAALKRAVRFDAACVRIYLIQARMALASQEYEKAIHYLLQFCQVDMRFLSEAIQTLFYCYAELNNVDGFKRNLTAWLQQDLSKNQVYSIADFMRQEPSVWHAAANLLAEYFEQNFSLYACAYKLRELSLVTDNKSVFVQGLADVNDYMDRLLSTAKSYVCEQCGFSITRHYWLCPSCHAWSTLMLHYQI